MTASRSDPVRDFFAVDTAGTLPTAQPQRYYGAAARLARPHTSVGHVDALAAATIATFADAVDRPVARRTTAARASSRLVATHPTSAVPTLASDALPAASVHVTSAPVSTASSFSKVITPVTAVSLVQQQVQEVLRAGSTRLTRTLLGHNRAAAAGSNRLERTQHPGAPVPAAIVAASASRRASSQSPSLYDANALDTSGQTSEDQQEKLANRLCIAKGCTRRIRSKGRCKAHGGGRRCTIDGCERSSQSHGLCIRHGGGTRCSHDGCSKAAQSNGLCKAHGGGLRCQFAGCAKAAQGGRLCRNHGGGQHCRYAGCMKGVQRGGFCASHGGTRYCQFRDCTKQDRGGGLCAEHGGGRRCKRPACTKPARRQGLCHTHALIAEQSTDAATTSRSLAPVAPTVERHTDAAPVASTVSVAESMSASLFEPLGPSLLHMTDHLGDM